ncbi:MAG: hypothetical protein HYU67_01375 [Flavobacteriia bacterium]|nr:hypothetical protein [Flavobacteriia bacterium]
MKSLKKCKLLVVKLFIISLLVSFTTFSQNSLISLSDSYIVYKLFDNYLEFNYEGNYDSLFIKSDKLKIKFETKNSALLEPLEEGNIKIDLYGIYKSEIFLIKSFSIRSFNPPPPSVFINDSLISLKPLHLETLIKHNFKLTYEKHIPLNVNYFIDNLVFEINGNQYKNFGSKIKQDILKVLEKDASKKSLTLKRIEYRDFENQKHSIHLDRQIFY